MQESYYDRLGVEKTADAQQIKRAYYAKVKQYPPERFPEEFKCIRSAYDTLSNERRRSAYDSSISVPENVASLFGQGKELERTGRHADAAQVYELVLKLHPGMPQALVALARIYEVQGKSGKVVSVWEQACENEPNNAEYAYELAMSYQTRSWNKKAYAQYLHALALDDGNENCWLAFMELEMEEGRWRDAESTCEQGLRAIKRHGKENILLSSYAFMFSAKSDAKKAGRHLSDIGRMMQGVSAEERRDTVRFLLNAAKLSRRTEFVGQISDMAATLPNIDDELQKQLDDARIATEIESLTDLGYPELFHDLIATLYEGCDCEDCRNDMLSMECHILAERNAYRIEILRLKKEFPHFYQMHAKFFNEVLRSKDLYKMLAQRLKQLEKHNLVPNFGWEEDWDDEGEWEDEPTEAQPVRREEPKVGRNDPCPCGSGKKYKKCCGANAS